MTRYHYIKKAMYLQYRLAMLILFMKVNVSCGRHGDTFKIDGINPY